MEGLRSPPTRGEFGVELSIELEVELSIELEVEHEGEIEVEHEGEIEVEHEGEIEVEHEGELEVECDFFESVTNGTSLVIIHGMALDVDFDFVSTVNR
jgi:hypothetical protein